MTLFRNTYRVESVRLKGYDYSSNGAYFITICTKNMRSYFGRIQDGEMELSPIGQIAYNCWIQLFEAFPNAIMDEFIIMPNHMHGLIIIKNEGESTEAIHRVSTKIANNATPPTYTYRGIPIDPDDEHLFLLPALGGITGKDNPMLSNHSIGKMIRWYKAKCTFAIRNELKKEFSWHTRFYDHIVRNETDMNRIRTYINNNPANFYKDKFYRRAR